MSHYHLNVILDATTSYTLSGHHTTPFALASRQNDPVVPSCSGDIQYKNVDDELPTNTLVQIAVQANHTG